MNATAVHIRRVYLILLLLHTLAASLIWGINTLFLLDAGLSNTQAFAVNAFFTAGQVLFEVPTGVIADTRGRRDVVSRARRCSQRRLSRSSPRWPFRPPVSESRGRATSRASYPCSRGGPGAARQPASTA